MIVFLDRLRHGAWVTCLVQIITAECIMTACCYVFILSFIQCSREKNNMSVISEVTLYCIPIYCVQHNIELDHLSKLMLNKKRSEYTTVVFLLGMI